MANFAKLGFIIFSCVFCSNIFADQLPKSIKKMDDCELAYEQRKMDQVVSICEKEVKKTNSTRALYILGNMYQLGINVPQNYELAGNYLQQAADRGDQEAQYLYAYLIYTKKLPNVDQRLAMLYFEQAAAQQNARAQYMLGLLHSQGLLGLDKSDKEAFDYYKKSADNGFAKAQTEVAKCYSLGLGVKENDQEAVKYLKMAVENHDLMAKYLLGIMYYQGLGVEKDLNKAKDLLGQAAKEGHRGAQQTCQEIKC